MLFPLMFCNCCNALGVLQDIGCEQLKGLVSLELIRFYLVCPYLGKDAAGCVEAYSSICIVGREEDKLQTLQLPHRACLCV